MPQGIRCINIALTKIKLDSYLRYDAESGQFFWHISGKGRRKSLLAGSANLAGYIVIRIEGINYMAHQLAWLTVYGAWPKLELDHIDRSPGNNRIENLREVLHPTNAYNTKIKANNSSGIRGVFWSTAHNLWVVQLGPQGNRITKYFSDMDSAKDFAESALTELIGATSLQASGRLQGPATVDGVSIVQQELSS